MILMHVTNNTKINGARKRLYHLIIYTLSVHFSSLHGSLHWTSYNTSARGLKEKLRQSHCRKFQDLHSPSESVRLPVNLFAGWKKPFCPPTSDYYKLLDISYQMLHCNLLENRFYCIIISILQINQLSFHYK